MTHYDGVRGEDFFENWINKNSNLEVIRVHKPFDFLVGEQYVEVKTAKLYVRNSKEKNYYTHGRYECWNQKQLIKLKKKNIWICFLIQHNRQYIIHGFAKSKDIPNKRVMSLSSIQNIPIKSKEQFLSYITRSK